MLTKWFILGLLVLAPAAAMAAADAEAGKAIAVPCGACHGQNGVALVPGAPNLAGQNPRYLVAQLQLIKSGARAAPLMAGQLTNSVDDGSRKTSRRIFRRCRRRWVRPTAN